MAKFKAAGSRKAPATRSNAAAIPCLLIFAFGSHLLISTGIAALP